MSESLRRDFLKTAGTALTGVAAIGTLSLPSAAAQDSVVKKRKIIGINGSHRVGKTCAQAIDVVFSAIEAADPTLETELIELASLKIGMPVVGGTQEPDDINSLFEKMIDSSCIGLVVASPIYFGMPSARLVAMIDRMMPLRRNWQLKNKIIGLVAVAAGRNGGQETVLHCMSHTFTAQQMILAVDGTPSSHWGATLWNQKDSIAEDAYGTETAKNLGTRIVELAKLV